MNDIQLFIILLLALLFLCRLSKEGFEEMDSDEVPQDNGVEGEGEEVSGKEELEDGGTQYFELFGRHSRELPLQLQAVAGRDHQDNRQRVCRHPRRPGGRT